MAPARPAPCTRFPRAARLTATAQYSRVFSGAERAGDRYFTVLFRRAGTGRPRLGLAVSRRAAPKAVARNRIKRLVRESFRVRQHQLGPCDIVVIAKAGARDAARAELHRSLARLWQKVASRCPGS